MSLVSGSSTAPTICVACGAAPERPYRLRNGAWLEQCPRCRLGWWAWPAFEPADFYDEQYFQSGAEAKGYDDYAALEPGVARTARTRLRRIERLLRARRTDRHDAPRLLELGCGTGVFLAAARRRGWVVEGVEVSAYAAERARARGLRVTSGAAELADFPAADYDCVCLWDVLEHVRDPARLLLRAGDALRPGGILALSTGDLTSWCARLSGAAWHLFNLPEHLFFFSPESLRRLLAQANCSLRSMTREVNWVPVGYIRERLRKARGAGAALAIAARLLPRRWVVPATLRDVLGVYAVRMARGPAAG